MLGAVKQLSEHYGIKVDQVRREFPMLCKSYDGKPLVYLDNAATTLKPWSVINTMLRFETDEYATVHRGSYRLGEIATQSFELTRKKVAKFIGAADDSEIVFTSGATEAINLVAASYGGKFIGKGDEIIVSEIEHHANIIPWLRICEEKEATLKVIPVDDQGDLMMEEYEKLLSNKTKIVAVAHVSNALGTVNPVKEIAKLAHDHGAVVLVDGAQSISHMKIDVTDIDADFFVFSGHKMYGPTGVGVLYGKKAILSQMPPYMTGGEMIKVVSFEKITYADPPHRFEAGTPPVSQVIGLGAAIDYLTETGMDRIHDHEHELLKYLSTILNGIDGLKVIGNPQQRAGAISFVLEHVHAHDIVTIMSDKGIAIRGGHHCAQPTMKRFNVAATARASVGVYNSLEEMDALAAGLKDVARLFA